MTRPTTESGLLAVLFSALMVSSLFAIAAVAAPESEANDTLAQADALVLDEATTGTLADGSDVDLFAFTAQRGQHLTLQSTRSTTEAGSHRVSVYEVADGSFDRSTRKADVVVTSGSTRRAGDTIERTGTYVAQAYQGTGSYEFTVTLETLADAAVEPNEVLADATPIAPDTLRRGQLALGDVDLYSFDATRGQELTALLSVPATATSSIRLSVYEVVNGSFDSSTPKGVDLIVSPGTSQDASDTIERTGTYVIQLSQGTGNYGVSLGLRNLDADEPNEVLADATPISPGESVARELSRGDVDLYTFDATRGQELTASLSVPTTGRSSIRLSVYEVVDGSFDRSTRKVDMLASPGETEQDGDTIERTGTYVAQVFQGTGDYTVSLDLRDLDADEPNEVLADATPIPPGESAARELSRSDIDLYAFDATRGQELTVSLSVPATGRSSISLSVYEVVDGSFDLSTLKHDMLVSPGTTQRTGSTIERTGTYVAQVFQGTGDYTVSLDLRDLDADEPNEVLADATPISPRESVTRELSRGDVDLYTFDATRGQELTVSLSVAGTGRSSARISVYEVVDGSLDRSTRKVNVIAGAGETETGGTTIQRSGTHVAQVSLSQGVPSVNYTLELGLRTLRNEPNDVLADATPYELGVEESAELTTGDVDLYIFNVTRGDFVNVSVNVPTNETSTVALLMYDVTDGSFDPGSWRTFLQVDPGVTETGGATVERDGQYLIRVFGGPANFSFIVTAMGQEFTEPNERRADATDLLPNPKAGAVLVRGDVDYYRFETRDVNSVVVVSAATATTRASTLSVRVFDDVSGLGSIRLGFDVGPGTSRSEEFTAFRRGTYLVVVDDAITPTAYDLSVTVDGEVVGVPNDRFERNENADQAPVLALGAYQDLRIVDTDVDVFAVDLVAGDRLNAAAALEVAGADDLSIAVTDDADAVLATGTSVPTGAEVVSVAPADGTYYVRVTGAGNATAAYDLTLRVGLAVSLSVDPQRLNAGPDEVVTVDVSLADADLNLSAYAFDLTVDPAVVTIAGVETLGSNLQVDTTVAPDGASASVDVVANDTLPSAGVTPLVRVTMLTGATDGESALTLTNASVVDGTGGAYPTSTVDGTVVVSTGPGDVGGGAPAGDLDGDGRFEDVDGDGKFNFVDIITLVFAIDRIDRGGLGSFFDFDGRGGFTFVDVIDLVFRL